MNRSRSHRRPYARTRRASGTSHGGVSRLADLAGRAPAPSVDALEPRQLLFSLTITPDLVNPFTGVGTASVTFGYVLPYYQPPEGAVGERQDPGEPEVEDFNDVLDEARPPLEVPTVNVPTGEVLESGLVLTHNILPASGFQFVPEAPESDDGRLRVQLDTAERFAMQVALGDDVTTVFQGLQRLQFEVQAVPGSIQGLNLDNMQLTLRFGGAIVAQFTGAELGALNTTTPGTGVGIFEIDLPGPGGAPLTFDQVEIAAIDGPNDAFFVDNVQWDEPGTGTDFTYADFVDERVFGVQLILAGPVGATVQVLDLYGRDMFATLALGIPQGADLALVDRNDDGVPEFNDGIGQFILTGFDERSTLTALGGTVEATQTGFMFTRITDALGLFDEIEDAGFGYAVGEDGIIGLPPGPGSIILGSPWVRDNSSAAAYNPAGSFTGGEDFNRTDQGVFARGSQNVGSVAIHGAIHGSSRIDGFAERVAFSFFPGSLTVKGDLGELIVGSDAGMWVRDDTGFATKTTGQLVVERTLGEVVIAGRSLMDVTVIADLSSPGARPLRDIYQYWERETVYSISPDLDESANVAAIAGNSQFKAFQSTVFPGDFAFPFEAGQQTWFGDGYFRNDSILSAEFVGSPGTAAEIRGTLDFLDPKNTAEDLADIYAFAVDGSRPVVISGQTTTGSTLLRIMDSDGRTLAAQEADEAFFNTLEYNVTWQPPSPGVYYLVLTSQTGNGNETGANGYVFEISGMAPTTFGAYRTGAGSGTAANQTLSTLPLAPLDNSITLLSGSMGAMRVGTAFYSSGGGEVSPDEIYNPRAEEIDDEMDIAGGTLSVDNGSVYQILAGADIAGVPGIVLASELAFVISGNLGQVYTGLSQVVGVGPLEGDLQNAQFEIGGAIATMDIRAGIGYTLDLPDIDIPVPDAFANSVNIRTGLSGGNGDIGFIRVGGHVYANRLNISTSPGSTIGGFAISQDLAFAPEDPFYGISGAGTPAGTGVGFNLGAGSDVRFVSIPRIDLEAAVDVTLPLRVNQAIEVIEDSGARVRLIVRGGGGVTGALAGVVRTVPIDGSEGVAIGEIEVNLAPGLGLEIEGVGGSAGDIISIGRIQINDGDGVSNIRLIGNVEIDVWQIFQGGGELGLIENLTPNGDIVAIDVPNINTLRIQRGDLGRTQVPVWGPQLIGPFVGIGGDAAGLDFEPLTINGLLDDDFNGGLYRGPRDTNFQGGNAFLTDIGSPIDPWLNGMVVRDGSIALVEVGGAVGDVIALAGDVGQVHANFQQRGLPGQFNGIFGNIYGNDVIEVHIGDGMLARGDTPIASASIVANDDIIRILGTNQEGATLSGVVAVSNNVINDRALTFDTDGIELIQVNGGRYLLAEILTGDLNAFWTDMTGYVTPSYSGDVGLITGNNTDFIRSDITTQNLDTFRLATGVYDASFIQTLNAANEIEAAMFMNSTTLGTLREFRESAIVIADTLANLRTTGGNGDILDTRVDVVRSITGSVSAFNIARSTIDADNTINRIDAVNLRGSSIIAGRLLNLNIESGIRTSSINISGVLDSVTADSIVSTSISVTGPDGRLNTVTVRDLFDGSILSTGPVGRLESTAGDVRGRLETRTARGTVDTIVAARDVDLETDISATLSSLRAGRNIGSIDAPKVLLVRDDLQNVDVSNGALYSDIRVGDNLTGAVVIGAVPARPGLNLVGSGSVEAFGRINRVSVTGDFGGSVVSHSGGINLVEINDGSFLAGGAIIAYDGDIGAVRINRGHLLGNIHADNVLYLVEVNASDDGVFGDIGVNPELSGFRPSADPNRHELPPGVGVRASSQGPTISAGRNLGRVDVTGGSVFETTFVAGQAIGVINIAGSFMNDGVTTGFNNHIVAGNSIARVNIGGAASDLLVLAGVIDMGPDGRPGGVGDDADLVKSGRVGMPGDGNTGVFIGGDARDVTVAAGMVAGPDGLYNTDDDRHALGLSYVSNVMVGGSVTRVTAFADTHVDNVSGGVTVGGDNTPLVGGVLESMADSDGNRLAPSDLGTVIAPGASFNFTHGADSGTIEYSGPGTLVWDAAGGRLLLINTTMQTDVTVSSESGHLSSFRIISNDDASVGRLEVNSNLRGVSDIYIDGYARQIVIDGAYEGSGSIGVGNDIQLFRVNGAFRTTGEMSAVFVREFDINGAFGGPSPTSPGTVISPTVTIFGGQTVSVDGSFRGVFSADRSISGAFTVGGDVLRGFVRSGGSIGRFEAASMRESFISARNNIGRVDIAGNAIDTSIIAGGDLGRDARFGGSGQNRDVVSTGSVGQVNIGGSFAESDVVAGLLRGPDGFFGTSDDIAASGRSNIGQVTIGGTALGSTRDTESYGVYATGTIAGVTAAGQSVTQRLNFRVERQDTRPVPIQVTNLEVVEDARQYTARLTFNQPMNASTLIDGIIVNEIRAPGVTIRLQENLDYDLEYDAATNTALVQFRRAVTDRDLPAATGVPGPGIYRFTLDPDVVRAQVNSARMDGNGDGFADDLPYSSDTIVGDAGDKVNNQQIFVPDGAGGQKQVDFRGAIDMDIVLDDNFNSNGLPEPNRVFKVRGSIGDHPDAEAEIFSFSGDVDVYKITLQAGQILRLGPSEGSATETERWLYSSSGGFQSPSGSSSQSVSLPTGFPQADRGSLATGENYLITVTDQYYLVIGNDPGATSPHADPGRVNDFPPSPRRVGSYAFDLEVFDDGDSGFSAPTDAGNGKRIPNAPPPAAFNGPDGMPGTADDLAQIVVGNFAFTVDRASGVVTGSDGTGVTSQRLADGRQLQIIDSDLGGRGAAGLPGNVRPDLDVYHLNNRLDIDAGTRLRVTVRLTDAGSDLGNRQLIPELQRDTLGLSFLGDVQLGVFDTAQSTGIGDGRLVAGPSDFKPVGQESELIASDGSTSYGYDEQGDFFMEFLAPTTTTYAVYLQGVFNANYRLEVVQQGTRPQVSAFYGPDGVAGTPDDLTNIDIGRFRYTLSGGQVSGELIPISQNVFLEFNGGEIDWLEAGGLTTMLRPFAGRGFGFTGAIDGVPVDRFIKDTVVNNLNQIFQGAGYDVIFSRDPSQFEFEDHSTVYISGTENPISGFFDRFFGFSQHVDVLNADRNDDAVVFAPDLAVLDYNPSPEEVRGFTESLTAAVGRRVGELLGLRATADTFQAPQVDLFSSGSVFETPTLGGRYIIPSFARPLSDPFDPLTDTNFYLGVQNSGSLLDRILGG